MYFEKTAVPIISLLKKIRLLESTFFRAFFKLRILVFEYVIPFDGQTVKQLKQLTHLSKSIFLFSLSMQPDLQTVSHIPHPLQSSWSMIILNFENLDAKPSSAPTGQIVLQNNLPFEYDIIAIVSRTSDENVTAIQLIAFNSIG